MARYRIVVTDQVFPSVDLERGLLAAADADLEVASGDRETVLARAADADALLNTYFPIDAEAMSRLERCRIIARYGIGVDNIDLDAARERGIAVTNVPDYCVEEVAAHAVAMTLALLRRLPDGEAVLRGGGWGIDKLRPIKRLSDTTIGVVGLGRIGRRVAELMGPFGAQLVGHDPFVTELAGVKVVDLDELLSTSDAVTLHCPLLPQTRGLINADRLAAMASDAVLVNTSRGPLVVLDDLLDALRDRSIRAAALDVFETEPVDAAKLDGVSGLLATPHMAFYSDAALAESQTKAANQIIKVLGGQTPDYQVNAS
ncbi:MAG TPA: C-terminal binding protein [Nocardioidaceae bacterium]|nr:C-terminal binding protein [Nocardioidaceae bacterium]